MAELHVTGLVDLQRLLDTLPAKVEKNVMRGALRAGMKIVKEQAKALCPVGQPGGENRKIYGGYEGALRDTIRVGVRSKGGRVTAYVKAGGKSKKGADVYYAHIIEYTGAVGHRIMAKKGKVLNINGVRYRIVNHPGMKPRPFMRPALDAQAQNAVEAAGEYIKTRLATKEGLDTADIVIEAEV